MRKEVSTTRQRAWETGILQAPLLWLGIGEYVRIQVRHNQAMGLKHRNATSLAPGLLQLHLL